MIIFYSLLCRLIAYDTWTREQNLIFGQNLLAKKIFRPKISNLQPKLPLVAKYPIFPTRYPKLEKIRLFVFDDVIKGSHTHQQFFSIKNFKSTPKSTLSTKISSVSIKHIIFYKNKSFCI